MLRSLREVQVDDSVVGFYQAMPLGSFYSQTLVETQAVHQDKLRHGGVVVVHGKYRPVWQDTDIDTERYCVDISQGARGNASFRAFRLTKAFLDAYKKNNFSTDRYCF